MPFEDDKFYAKATHADVAAVAIRTSIALSSVARALEALRDGRIDNLNEHIKSLREDSDRLDEMFNQLTGYAP
jgi:hypothetical protein